MEQILAPLATRQQKRFDCIVGDSSRHLSISNGLAHLEKQNPDIVIVHDGARPIVDQDTLHRLVSAAHIHGACGIICRLTSTILKADEESEGDLWKLKRALNRYEYMASETPQAFRTEVLIDAYQRVRNIVNISYIFI